MRPWSVRRLTEGERRLGVETFGDEVDVERVRLWAPPIPRMFGPRPFVAGNLVRPGRDLIVWTRAPADFTHPDVSLYVRSVFIHEMTHVWQSQRGVNLLFAKLRAGDRAASYEYVLETGSAWPAFNIEQQAMIVQHDYLRRCGGQCPYPAEAYQAVLPFRSRAERPFQA
jgi:hypothetical protein